MSESVKDLPAPTGRNDTGTGSGFFIGDGVIITAGHVMFEFNEKETLSDRAIRLMDQSAVYYDPRNYQSQYSTLMMGLSQPLPIPSSPEFTVSSQYIEPHLIPSDIVFVTRSGSVDKDDAGLMIYIDPTDISDDSNSLIEGSRLRRTGTPSVTATISSVAVSANGNLLLDVVSDHGDSGGGVYIETENKKFILGNVIAITGDRAKTISSYITSAEFYELNSKLQQSQAGNVTASEPTNLIVGSSGNDTGILGTYRADIFLGKGGDDLFTDEPAGAAAWGDDQIFGGDGNDTFFLQKGNDLAHGGDYRDYGSGRTTLNDDGFDTVDYSHSLSSDPITIKTNVTGAPSYANLQDGQNKIIITHGGDGAPTDSGVDTLISIEKIVGTAGVDKFEIEAFSTEQLAGSDHKGGLAEINFGGNDKADVEGDLVDASKLSDKITINLSDNDGVVQVTGDAEKKIKISNAERAWTGSGNDELTGNVRDNDLRSGGGDDQIHLTIGDDKIDAGEGSDTIIVDDELQSITIDLRVKEEGANSIKFQDSKSLITGAEIFKGNASKTTFWGDGSGATFIAGSGGGDFHLLAGDKAVGHDSVVDNFYVQTTIPSEVLAGTNADKIAYLQRNKVMIENFGAEDRIFVNGVQFDGNKVTSQYWGITVGSDRNLDWPETAYTYSGTSSYGTSYANPTFDVRGANWGGQPWGALEYQDGQYRDAIYSASGESGVGVIDLFSRGYSGYEYNRGTYQSGMTGFSFNELSVDDEQLSIVISGFQNGYGGITFENDGLANLRPDLPGDEGGDDYTQTFDTSWADGAPQVLVPAEADIFDGNADGYMSPGGLSVGADDPLFNLGNQAFDGEVQDWDAFISAPRSIAGSSGGDYLEGGWANDEIAGGDGDDYIVGGAGDDLLDGGSGDDTILGGDGNDVLIGGDGDDVLVGGTGRNTLDGGDGYDRVEFAGAASDYRIYRNADGSIGVDHLSSRESVSAQNVEELYFEGFDETISIEDLPLGTPGSDQLVGSDRADLLNGGGGDDEMIGGAGDDIYIIDSTGDMIFEDFNQGTDTVRTYLNNYTLSSNLENIDFIGSGAFVGNGNELANQIVSGDGDDLLTGGDGDDSFVTGSGADIVDGGDGYDVLQLEGNIEDYSFSMDDLGAVTITQGANSVALTNVEVFRFSNGDSYGIYELMSFNMNGTEADDFLIEGDDDDNKISGLNGNDSLRGNGGNDLIDGGDGQDTALFSGNSADYQIFYDASGALIVGGSDGWDVLKNVESLLFDGDNLALGIPDIPRLGAVGDDTINGSARSDRLSGLAGDDILFGGAGDDVLDGGLGNDVLDGGQGEDYLVGGTGNDNYRFGSGEDSAWDEAGDDVYCYQLGDGVDVIDDRSGFDKIILGSAIATDEVHLAVDGNDIVLNFNDGGSLTITAGFEGSGSLEEIRFADGTVWDPIVQLRTATDGDDNLIGSAFDDTLSGGAGNDLIDGRQGNDALAGGVGDDLLWGQEGDDTYQFALGDGVDIVREYSGFPVNQSNGDDALVFGPGVGPGDIQVSMANAGRDIVLAIGGTTDKVILENSAYAIDYNIEAVKFADGTIWNHSDLMSRILISTAGNDLLYGSFAGESISGGGGNDTIIAGGGDDVISGDAGNDSINGGEGNDLYHFDLGDGQDKITDYTGDPANSLDVLEFGAGISASDVVVSQADSGWDLVLSITGSSDKVTLDNAAFATGNRVEKIAFADGTEWNFGTLMSSAYAARATNDTYWGTSGADVISGGAGSDVLNGGAGNDYLDGGTGSDTMVGGAGDDYYVVDDAGDIVTEISNGAVDTVASSISYTLGANIENLVLVGTGAINGNGNNLANIITGNSFANTLAGLAGNDQVDGGDGDDIVEGGAGSDIIIGGIGVDTARFSGKMADYSIATNSGSITVIDSKPASDGDDGTDTLSGIEELQFQDGSIGLASPIILDLDGDGIELTSRSSNNVSFDWNGDGLLERCGWIGAGDGFLVFDRNGDGNVNDAGELSFVTDKSGAKSDLDGLSAFDSNGDGQFSVGDSEFNRFRIWRDLDVNGQVSNGELMTLEQAGVASIDLSGAALDQTWGWNQNIVVNIGQYMGTDGVERQFADAALNYVTPNRSIGDGSTINGGASRFAEALARFGDNPGTSSFSGHGWVDKREFIFARNGRISLM